MNKMLATQLTLVTFLFVISVNAYSQTCPGSAGCLDPAFGIGGTVVTMPPLATVLSGSRTSDMDFQSDGKIVILTYANDAENTFRNALVRLTTDGNLDASFGSGGFVYINWNAASGGLASSLDIQIASGHEYLVVSGSSNCPSACIRAERYDLWGNQDLSFGTGGVSTVNTGWYPSAMAIQSDQKILIAGGTNPMVRLKSNGQADTTFGPNGISTKQTGMNIRKLQVISNGQIVAAGETWGGSRDWNFSVARFSSNASLDTAFGTGGRTSVDFAGKLDIVGGMTIDSLGRILVCGEATYAITNPYPKGFDAVMIRLKSNGKLDTSFGSGGKTAPLNLGNLQDYFASVSVQTNGKIILTGESRLAGNNANSDILVARFNPDGTLDTSFHSNGWVTTDIYGAGDTGIKGLVQFDPACGCEKFVIAGIAAAEQSAFSPRYIVGLRILL